MYVFAIVGKIAGLGNFNRGGLEIGVRLRLRGCRAGTEESEGDGEHQALDQRIACSGGPTFLGTGPAHTGLVYLFVDKLALPIRVHCLALATQDATSHSRLATIDLKGIGLATGDSTIMVAWVF